MMGCCIELWRCAIGTFNNRITVRNVRFTFKISLHSILYGTNIVYKTILFLMYLSVLQSLCNQNNIALVLILLLMISGDIHKNPGPTSEYESSSFDTSSIPLSSVNDNSIKIMHLNIRSIRRKIDFLESFTDDVDILCLTETHLDPSIKDCDISITNFQQIHRKDRNSFGGGVIVYSSINLNIKRRLDIESNEDEIIWVELNIDHTKYILGILYKPPTMTSRSGIWLRLRHSLDLAFGITPNVLLTGDVNIDLLEKSDNVLFDILRSYNLTNIVDSPTRVTNATRKLLDPFIVSDTVNVESAIVIPVVENISDHRAVLASINTVFERSKPFRRKIWQYDKANILNLRTEIGNFNWENLLNDTSDLDEKCSLFNDKILQILEKHIPCKTVTVKENDKPWMTRELRNEIKHRNKLRKIYIRKKTPISQTKYKRSRNKVSNMIKYAREKFIENVDIMIDKNSTNPKGYWKIMRMLVKGSFSTAIPPLYDPIKQCMVSMNMLNVKF